MRRNVLAFAATLALGVSGVAAAGTLSAGRSSSPGPPGDDIAETSEQDTGVHGGPIERFQRAGSCDLTPVSQLPGNWTHGDYVTAVAASGDPALTTQAAHSDCGKPMVSVGHGNGPPAHALENKAAGQAHAGSNRDDAETDASGS